MMSEGTCVRYGVAVLVDDDDDDFAAASASALWPPHRRLVRLLIDRRALLLLQSTPSLRRRRGVAPDRVHRPTYPALDVLMALVLRRAPRDPSRRATDGP